MPSKAMLTRRCALLAVERELLRLGAEPEVVSERPLRIRCNEAVFAVASLRNRRDPFPATKLYEDIEEGGVSHVAFVAGALDDRPTFFVMSVDQVITHRHRQESDGYYHPTNEFLDYWPKAAGLQRPPIPRPEQESGDSDQCP